MRQLPILTYSGLTVLLDKCYRFDREERFELDANGNQKLFMGSPVPLVNPATNDNTWPSPLKSSTLAGSWFDDTLIRAGYRVSRNNIEVRTLDSLDEPFLAGTRCVLALGEGCAARLLDGVSLGEQRGSPVMRPTDVIISGDPCSPLYQGYAPVTIPWIFSFAPQDAEDRADYFSDDEDREVEGAEDKSNAKAHGKTRRKNWKFWTKADIRKAARIAREGLRQLPEPTYHLWPEAREVISILKTATNCNLYFDIETVEDLRMTCFGFSVDEGRNVYVVPMLQTHLQNTYYYGEETTYLILHALGCALLRNTVVVHNSMFDLFVTCWRCGLPLGHRVFDSMLSHNRVFIEVEKSLGHVISLYTDLPYHKNEGVYKPWNSMQAESLYRYNGKDVYAMTQLKPAIEAEAVRLGATESMQLANRMVRPYLTATLQGMKYDRTKLEARADHNEKMLSQIEKVIALLVGYPLNPRSPKQVADYLYSAKGLNVKKPAQDPTNEKTLLGLLLKHDVYVIPWLLKYRGISKEGAYKLDDDGKREGIGGAIGFTPWDSLPVWNRHGHVRFTTSWKLAGTTTMRLASAALLGTWGSNAQNWSKDLRKLFVPDDGKVFVQVDQAGAEALIVSYLAPKGQYRDLFLNKIKPHTFLALHVFKDKWKTRFSPMQVEEACNSSIQKLTSLPFWKDLDALIRSSDDWAASERYYYIAKMICHASSYGMGPVTFRTNVLQKSEGAISLRLDESRHYLDMFHRLFSEIRIWQEATMTELRAKKMLRNLFGHPRVFSSWIDDSVAKEAYAFVPQSTVGQITNLAFVELAERVESSDPLMVEAGVDVLQNNHDSVLVQCYPQYASQVAKEVQKHLNRTMTNSRNETFTMKSEASVGDSWGTVKAIKD